MGAEYLSETTIRDGRKFPAETHEYTLFLISASGVRMVSLPTSGAIVVGRGSRADIRVSDVRMSRCHARIHLGQSFAIEDLNSANGTAVRGTWLSNGELRQFGPGDAIVVGGTTLLIQCHVNQAGDRPPGAEPAPGAGDCFDQDADVSDPMKAVLALADRAATWGLSVLLLGETGVGKDVLAERIHRVSPRAGGPFLRLNCAAFSPTLLASELFGHEKGAFTGAVCAQQGLLHSANGGTVFFDEIGELPLDLQAKLLIVLERREVLPVGAVRPKAIDVRFISATNRPLPSEVEAGRFRRDLFHRLNGVTIEVPPLRARVAEIEGLSRKFAAEAATAIGQPAPALSGEVLAALRAYAWPGNIRELRAVIDRAVLLSTDGVIRPKDLLLGAPEPPKDANASSIERAREEAGLLSEKQLVVEALAKCGGNQTRAAKLLGISRNTLIARIKHYGLARPLPSRARS